jgi:hypothetical protein
MIRANRLHWYDISWCICAWADVSQDLSNPEVAKHLTLYPEVCKGPISEVWQAMRWREFDKSQLNPMWTPDGLKRFYVDELAQLQDGRFIIPQMWFTNDGVVHATYIDVRRLEVCSVSSLSDTS